MALAVLTGASFSAQAAPSLPEIRLSGSNAVPSCVTPDRLMAFLKRRNGNLDPRFRDIASYYKRHGEAWGVRWDYAFFQMAIETNFLTYRAPNGRMGDVDPKQNNFAGIGTTGGGVPGDSFPDVSTGVLGQIQHLVVYSGEMIANPVAPRTQLKQEHILEKSRELNRPVRFSDLARRWAADPKYGRSIEWVADRFRTESCKGRSAPQAQESLPWTNPDGARAEEPQGKAIAVADVSPTVRTIWSRDQKAPPAKKAEAEKAKSQVPPAVAAKADAKRATKPAQAPAAQLGATAPSKPAPELSSVEAKPADETDAPGFALFSPPAALADVKIAPPRPDGSVSKGSPAAKAHVVPVKPREKHSDADIGPDMGPRLPPVAAAPDAGVPQKDEPKAVSGKTVAGFMIGGSGGSEFAPPSGLGVKPGRCVIESARYGGETTVLVKSPEGDDVHYVALSVLDGFEDSMTKTFLASRSEGGEVLGTFLSRDEALSKARSLCPD